MCYSHSPTNQVFLFLFSIPLLLILVYYNISLFTVPSSLYTSLLSSHRSYCRAEREVKESRLTVDQLRQLTEEQQLREAEERKMRTEQARCRNMEIKQRELEEVCVCVCVCVCARVCACVCECMCTFIFVLYTEQAQSKVSSCCKMGSQCQGQVSLSEHTCTIMYICTHVV